MIQFYKSDTVMKSNTVIEKWYSYRTVVQLSISETVTEKWYSYWKVKQLSKSDTVLEKWYSYR